MTSRAPARLFAPAALLTATVIAVAIVALGSAEQSSGHRGSGEAPVKPAGPRIFRVRRGDTLSSISIQTDVPLATLYRLNHANHLALQSGQRIKLRPIRR